MTVQKIKSGRIGTVTADQYIGDKGTIFYNESLGDLRLSDGITLGGIALSTGGGGSFTPTSISGSLIPSVTLTYDLGSPSKRWNSLYLSTNTIYLGNSALEFRGDGFYLNGQNLNYTLPTASTGTLGGVKVDGTTITINNGVITAQASLLVGPQGIKGDTGAQGPKGDKGDTGAAGATGPQGEQGLKGDTGATGAKGDKGDTGAQGVSVTLLGTVATAADLPPTGNSLDNGYLVQDTGHLWFWGADDAWHDVGQIVGPQGDKGDTGEKGDKGDTGATGPKGDKGDTGATGATGPQGEKGDKGDTGDQGPQGDPGPQGIQGETGPQGLKGDTGETGLQGDKGDKGDTGLRGSRWFSGTGNPLATIAGLQDQDFYFKTSDNTIWQFVAGNQTWYTLSNITGAKGDKGDTGATGAKGDKGDTGATGPQGEQGLKGDKGDTGSQGIQGVKGDKGDTGEQGIQGETGPQGEQGIPGISYQLYIGISAPVDGSLFWYNTDDNRLYVNNSGVWSDASPQVPHETFSGDYTDLTNAPILSVVAISGNYDDLINKPILLQEEIAIGTYDVNSLVWFNPDDGRTYVKYNGQWVDANPGITPYVPTDISELTDDHGLLNTNGNSGVTSYNDLTDKPSIPAAQIQSDWTQSDTGALDYIKHKPSIPNLADYTTSSIYVDGEGHGLVVDTGGLKRFGFMKYYGIEGSLVHTVGNSYAVPLRIGRVNTDDVTQATVDNFTTEIFVGTDGKVGINTVDPSAQLTVNGEVNYSGVLKNTNTTASTITAILTQASDPNFQLTVQNGISTNDDGDEIARVGINYVNHGWGAFTQYIRGNSYQDGYQNLYASNTKILQVNGGGVQLTGGLYFTNDDTTQTTAYTGNADTATKLATARDINGVSFDGSADINIPSILAVSNSYGPGLPLRSIVFTDTTNGVNITTATGVPLAQTTKTWLFDFDGKLNFPDGSAQTTAYTGLQTTITGNAGTATKLATARNINGIAFDGSADINVSSLVNGTHTVSLSSSGNLVLPSSGALIGQGTSQVGSKVVIATDVNGGTFLNGNGLTVSNTSPNTTVQYGWTILFGDGVTTRTVGNPYVAGSNLIIPFSSSVNLSNAYPVTITSPDYVAATYANVTLSSGSNNWVFNTSGGMVFPDSTTQTSAWTGVQTSVTGNAGTATKLQTARNINSVSFDGTADITVTAAAGTLTGTTLASGVTASSLTSVGTLTGLAVTTTATTNAINVTYNPSSVTGYAIAASGKNSQGGSGYFDFLKSTNTSTGATNPSKSFRLNSVGNLQIINNAYTSTIFDLSDTGDLTVTGHISPGTWTAGQVVKEVMLGYSDITRTQQGGNNRCATDGYNRVVFSYSYTPTSSSSYLAIDFHLAKYTAAQGTGNDSWFSQMAVIATSSYSVDSNGVGNGSEISYSWQSTVNGNRSGMLFPLKGRYTNSDTAAKTIYIAVRRDSADDYIDYDWTATSVWMRITEIAR